MTNPYKAPADPQDLVMPTPDRPLGIEFESDWSPEGLRLRRQQWWHRGLDIGFGVLTVVALGSILTASPYAGAFCVLMPVWVLSSVVWFTNLGFRNGAAFHRKYPGLSGRVRGSVDAKLVVVHGPAVSLATATRNCLSYRLHASHASLQPPGFETSLPIAEQDIQRRWAENTNVEKPTPHDMMEALSDHPDAIHQEDVLRGSDLSPLGCWGFWRLTGIATLLLGTLGVLWCVVRLMTLPTWVLQPPSHYQLSDSDVARIAGPVMIGIVGLAFFAAGFWQWSRTWRQIGEFSVCVDPTQISIASKAIAYSYHDEALEHFRWSNVGIVAYDVSGRAVFAIPARWFDKTQQRRLMSWYDRDSQTPERSHYIGPKW